MRLQASTAKRFSTKTNDKIVNIHDCIKLLNSLPVAFDQLLKNATVSVTLPVSSAASGRFFSTLKRVKTYLRLTMSDERLSNLLIISAESQHVKKLDMETLVDKYGSMANRKFPIII